jgi:hypothetical protein
MIDGISSRCHSFILSHVDQLLGNGSTSRHERSDFTAVEERCFYAVRAEML